jgi:alpha-ribazole phosphatase/probable phosphoglycerate mutase
VHVAVRITYFVHGTTTDNEAGLSSGWNDVALSDLGIRQSKALRDQTLLYNFDVVFTSDLSRAYNSAKLTWGDKYKIIQDSRLRECNYGDLNGKSSEIVEPRQEQSIEIPMPNGESYEQVKTRIAEFLQELKQNYDGKHTAIVAHKAPQLALDTLLRNMSWQDAFESDWRKFKKWQPGWEYVLD